MSIYVTGDCHGDWMRFQNYIFYEGEHLTRDDYAIVAGDFGIWNGGVREELGLERLETLPFTILFVDGNHENFDRLLGDEFPELDFHGGRAKQIKENVFWLERGYVFELCGKKIFAFGGAASHDIWDGILAVDGHERHIAGEDKDKYFTYIDQSFESKEDIIRKLHVNRSAYPNVIRVKDISWWTQEMPNAEEMARGWKSLEANDNKVDFIVTHCAPTDVASVMMGRRTKPDPATGYLSQVAQAVSFDKWFFGHYHDNRNFGKYILLYEQIIQIA